MKETIFILRLADVGIKAFDTLAEVLGEVETLKREDPDLLIYFSVEEIPR